MSNTYLNFSVGVVIIFLILITIVFTPVGYVESATYQGGVPAQPVQYQGGLEDTSGSKTQINIPSPLKVETLQQFIELIVSAIVQVGAIVLFFSIIYTGFLFVYARGKDAEITKAKTAFFWTVIGGAIILGAFVILQIIQGTLDQLL